MNKLTLRKIHRWLGLIAGLQLLAWTLSGLYFTLIPISDIHGDHLLDLEAPATPTLSAQQLLSPSALLATNPELSAAKTTDLKVAATLGRSFYLVGNKRFDAVSGIAVDPISEEEALAVVKERTSFTIVNTTRIESVPIDSEYRGGELPAWRFTLENEDAALYVGTTTGRIRAVRTNAWRLFDFLWMLHIMDYDEREDFNHLLIQGLALLGLATVLSGLVLFFVTQRWGSKA